MTNYYDSLLFLDLFMVPDVFVAEPNFYVWQGWLNE